MTIKVLVIDDSPLIRSLLTEILNAHADIDVVATAEDPYDAREKIKHYNPDVLTLDIEMPKMNGLSFLRNLMRLRPMPVVMVSTLTEKGAPAALQALELGAVDFIAKPKSNILTELSRYHEELTHKVRVAATSKNRIRSLSTAYLRSKIEVPVGENHYAANHLVAIGASTGGTEAIKELVRGLPVNMSPIVITQHIPPVFSTSFAKRLNSVSKMQVFEAQHGQQIEQGCIYLAPGDRHLTINKKGHKLFCQLDDDAPVNRHRPSVEKLFDSVAKLGSNQATGIMLTGMGADGAYAMLNMRKAGQHTIAQDEATSVVWGMPGAAVEQGAIEQILPLQDIAPTILRRLIVSNQRVTKNL
ncbi:protein-glutamate methylesterase/protein-glutamine glutaminase [Catenovulum sediminis]|uniref:Protein-glutamate methylesterase/protein-glutamine glutaminase n=1 Tax=Catenovulum sediminis TaxID=1740262 RepID=A0ABV1RM66_9ALTE